MYEHYPILNHHKLIEPLDSSIVATLFTQDLFGEQAAMCGIPISQSWTSGSKEITGVQTVYLSSVANTSSIWKVSLQTVSSSGNPVRPTGTILAFATQSNTITASIVTTHTFTSSYTITTGSNIAVVFEWVTLVGGNVALQRGADRSTTSEFSVVTSTTTGSSWVNSILLPHIHLVCADGSILRFKGADYGIISSTVNGINYNSQSSGTGVDSGAERGMLWIPNKTYDVYEVNILGRLATTASRVDIVMYRDTTALASQSYSIASSIGDSQIMALLLDPPVRVYPGENIRFTSKPTFSDYRHFRMSFASEYDKILYLGGPTNETTVSVTNRTGSGAWVTPPSASISIIPFNIYGYEVTGSALVSGSKIISGSVKLDGVPIEGAQIRAMRQIDGIVTSTTSSAEGNYTLHVTSSNYHVFVQHQSGSQLYNAVSLWNILAN